MCLLALPTELLLSIPTFLQTERDISSLSRCSTRLHTMLTPWLYRYNSRHGASSSLSWAVKTGNESTARLSIREGGDPAIRDDSGWSLLSRAAHNGHLALVKTLVDTGKVEVNSKDTEDRTALFWAAANGHDAVVKFLIEQSADPSSVDAVGWTVLFLPAANGYSSVVEQILATGRVDVDSRDAEGRTPLYMAAAKGHDAVVRLLVQHGKVNLNSKDSQGRSLSYWPMVNGYKHVRQILLDAEATHAITSMIVPSVI
ncbi:unnamed protein product [Penicillium salamii]|uniref:F-box domain-containing protein n=1 Tax=Penicillium salamii TaxID=1612424 RepID=A0A9W4NKT5_9EURO|nr:unnamed protein product [Penicillium salamii]CAG8070380.1 unnamed protein product [Penicillium salamii]CAG8169972.1 unnamed protein product [Penicillium salamii]CAG8231076.1 unnamed protein product [Penicillium salamii]CAG8247104.1 unnamed protein product [Penicillium salamii]